MFLHLQTFYFSLTRNYLVLTYNAKGTFFWDYSVDSYSGIRITEHTEYQFPKEQNLCYSEDMPKIKVMRPRKSRYAIFPPKDRRKLPNEHDYRLFCLFRTNCYSVYTIPFIPESE